MTRALRMEPMMRSFSEIPRPVRLFLLLALAFDVVGVACESVARFVLRADPPFGSPVLDERGLPDLRNFIPPFQHLHTPAFFSLAYPAPYMYPAPVAPLYAFFLSLPHRTIVFELVLALVCLVGAVLFGRHLVKKGLSIQSSSLIAGGALVLSYPVAFELRQGNMELFVCVLVGLAIWLLQRDRLHWAAVCIGIAGSMKLFPFVYLGLFLSRRSYRPVVTAVAAAALTTLASLRYLSSDLGLAWHGIAGGLNYYQVTTALRIRREIGFDHSIFAVVKRLIEGHLANPEQLALLLRGYLLIAALGGIAVYFSKIRQMPVVNQVLTLCIASILLPPISYDYTLLHLYIPWAMLVVLAIDQKGRVTPGLMAAFAWFAVATSIQTELIYHARTYEGQIKAIALIALMVISLRYPFRDMQNAGIQTAHAS